jgi:transcriptional regulator with XRE-family HTH domain
VQISEGELLQKIGKEIRRLRKQKGYSSYENFALDFDLDRKYYWNIEKGRNITILYLKKILDIHKINFSEFFNNIT